MKICKQYCNSLTELVFFWRVSDISRHFVTNSWHDGQFLTSSWPIPDVFGQNLVIFWRIPDELVKTWREMTSIWRLFLTSYGRHFSSDSDQIYQNSSEIGHFLTNFWRVFRNSSEIGQKKTSIWRQKKTSIVLSYPTSIWRQMDVRLVRKTRQDLVRKSRQFLSECLQGTQYSRYLTGVFPTSD